jgi:hypothetical protein
MPCVRLSALAHMETEELHVGTSPSGELSVSPMKSRHATKVSCFTSRLKTPWASRCHQTVPVLLARHGAAKDLGKTYVPTSLPFSDVKRCNRYSCKWICGAPQSPRNARDCGTHIAAVAPGQGPPLTSPYDGPFNFCQDRADLVPMAGQRLGRVLSQLSSLLPINEASARHALLKFCLGLGTSSGPCAAFTLVLGSRQFN